MRYVTADLHIHTALSPCGADEMTPPAIVQAAVEAGLDMIAICDHNSTRNVSAVQRAAGELIAVIAGIEITSVEEVHVVGLFPDAAAAETTAAEIRDLLPVADSNYYSFFGDQAILGADGSRTGTESAALAVAATLDLNQTVALIKKHGGLAIAAHIDRRAFGVISQLGWFPADAGFDGVEISRHTTADSPRMDEFRRIGLPIMRASDSHYLDEIGMAPTVFRLEQPTFAELARAFAGADGRSVSCA